MMIAGHQPNFLPWLGFFDRIRRAERFVLLDHVQFERQNFQNRCKIVMGGRPMWMTVPVVQKSRDERIVDKEIRNAPDGNISWGEKLYLTLEHAYGKAPYFRLYAGTFRSILTAKWERLVDLNLRLLEYCLEALEIRTPMARSSQLQLEGRKSELVLGMCRAVGADAYLAGMGGSRGYLDVESFARAGVRVLWQEFRHPRYRPSQGAPVEGLSVVDLLFHCGPRSAAVLKESHVDPISDSVAHAG